MITDIAIQNLVNIDSDDVFIVTDVETRKIINHNNALFDMFNYSVIGKTLNELIESTNDSLTIAELRYCEFIESECVDKKRGAVSIEQFQASMYLCVRFISTKLDNGMIVFTILKKLKVNDLLPNQVVFL